MRSVVRRACFLALAAALLLLAAPDRFSTAKSRQTRLSRPPLKGWAGLAPSWQLLGDESGSFSLPKGFSHWAVAREAELHIFGAYGAKAWVWGKIREGQRVPVKYKKAGDHCARGNWYETPDRAYLCNSHGFTITRKGNKPSGLRPPDLERTLPYRYVKPKEKPVLQFDRLPDEEELRAALHALEQERPPPEVVDTVQEGAFFIAVDRTVKAESGTFYRSIAGHYVQADDMQRFKVTTMRGELLGRGGMRLPVAFVHGESAPLLCAGKAGPRRCGLATRHARFPVVREPEQKGKKYVQGPGRLFVARDQVRVARRVDRPSGVAAADRWVHFDLSQQVLVAYEGDRPVFTTLFSSGKEGHETPTGLYRIYLKYISARMSGDDPKDGPYDIGEVPWVMYYKHSYAVHGAYWHDVFGNTRSHGCTNLTPADARWLYFWTGPRVPQGWHGMYAREGTPFYFTR